MYKDAIAAALAEAMSGLPVHGEVGDALWSAWQADAERLMHWFEKFGLRVILERDYKDLKDAWVFQQVRAGNFIRTPVTDA